MADETNPEIPAAPQEPAPRKPAARKPAAKKPAAPEEPMAAAAKPVEPAPAAPAEPTPAAPAEPVEPATPAIPVPPAEPAAPTAVVPEASAVPAATAAPAAPDAAAAYAAPPASPAGAPKRKIWPFVLGGGILVLILIIVGIVFAVGAVLGALGGDPKKTVTDYDLSFETADCELFQSTTTTEFQDNFFGEPLDCDRWVENAEALTVDGVYSYDVKVVISKTDGETAEVVTNETDSSGDEPVDYTLRYYLTKVDGHWLIGGIDNES